MTNITRNRLHHPEIPTDTPICSKCCGVNDRPPHRYCRACHAKYMRDWRAISRETNVSRDEEFEHVAGAVAALEGRAA